MNKLILTAVTGSLLAFSSCTQEELTPAKVKKDDLSISFRAGVIEVGIDTARYTGAKRDGVIMLGSRCNIFLCTGRYG